MTTLLQRRTLLTVLTTLLACTSASAQSEASASRIPQAEPARPATAECADLLATAEQRYADQVFIDVEPLVLDCAYSEAATPSDVRRAYRLLALAYIKQGLMAEAGRTVVGLLERDPAYTADPGTDLPSYVAIVDAARGQMNTVPARSAAPPPEPAGQPSAPPALGRVDVNSASVEALDAVPGIGPALAARIVAHRQQNGPFRSPAELEAVRGIGPRSVERMLPYLTAGGDVAPATAAGTGPLVNVNTATAEELEALPGIGPALAGRIVEHRETAGIFRDLQDLRQVRGIGEGKLEALAPFATVR